MSEGAIAYAGIDHVQLAGPPGCEPAARAFYAGLMGMTELPKPADMAKRGGCWFRCGAQEVHIGVEEGFHPSKKAHPALRLADQESFARLKARLEANGVALKPNSELAGVDRFFANDPFGNRIELVCVAAAAG